jgi:hypothetical protein
VQDPQPQRDADAPDHLQDVREGDRRRALCIGARIYEVFLNGSGW